MCGRSEGPLIEIDGATGEGGGQILRTALSLATAGQRPIRIINVRANRRPPGLRAQHLTSIRAAGMISAAKVIGAEPGSTRVEFHPRSVPGGKYTLRVGTAGSTALVLQTVALPLALAEGDSRVTITGGTHCIQAPCYEYLLHVWAGWMERVGISVEVRLDRPGFFPRGGGQITASITGLGGAQRLRGVEVTERGRLVRTIALAAVANLPMSIAERKARAAQEMLQAAGLDVRFGIEQWQASDPGGVCFVGLQFEATAAAFFSLAARGKPAEVVGREAAQQVVDYLQADGAVDPYAADQIMLPLALAPGPSRYTTTRLTQHTLTNAAVIEALTDRRIAISGAPGSPAAIEIA
jgi:RNA 3'-phosphate cyclase